jgi:NAD(P)-dependent dehydrogenase (short-subunit alcohol dehydrogenase family)
MQELSGKTAFVTGGASGIGLALARAFAAEGMAVMLADIEPSALDAAVADLTAKGARVAGVVCDVADPASVEAAAQATITEFGKVHIVCNNAGVAAAGHLDPVSLSDWRWVTDVNLMGVVHGVAAFLPHIRAHGEGGHFVNTASIAGMMSTMGFSPYTASKFAVVGASEGLAQQLAWENIGVSILCPAFVRTRIHQSGRNRPAELGPTEPPAPDSPGAAFNTLVTALVEAGSDPEPIAAATLAAIRANALYVFTHPERVEGVEARFDAILAAMKA